MVITRCTAQEVIGPYPAEHRAHSLSRSQLNKLLGRLGAGGLAGGSGSLLGVGLRGPRLNTREAKLSNFCRADISRRNQGSYIKYSVRGDRSRGDGRGRVKETRDLDERQ